MDIANLIGSIVALIGAGTGIWIASTTRKKSQSDAALAITQAAEAIVTMREKDAAVKQITIDALDAKVSNLLEYVDYLHDWIGDHVDGKDVRPMTFREFMNQKAPPK